MHRISRLRVVNFRACADVSIDVDSYTPLVGPNNTGKSTLLDAISWVFAPTKLTESDFYDPAKEVFVEAEVNEIDSGLLDKLEAKHRKKIEPSLEDGTLRIRRVCPKPGTAANKTQTLVRNPNIAGDSDADAWPDNPGGIWASISALFPDPIRIGAMEDSAVDASKFKTTTTLGRLIAELTADLVAEVAPDYSTAVAEVAARLCADGAKRPKQLTDFDAQASKAVEEFFPGVGVKLHIPTPELKDLFKSGTLAVFDQGEQRDFTALGHGAQRSIQMALVRILADRKAGAAKGSSIATRLLLIDEPELYLHPTGVHAVREALKKLTSVGYQVVGATHSPLMVEQDDAANAVIIGKDSSSGTFARPTLRHSVAQAIEDAPHQASCLFSLTNSSEILFSDRVLIAEGKTEKRLIPHLFPAVQGESLRARGIALVDAGGVGSVVKAREILNVLGLTAKVVVDLDFALRGAVKAGWVQTSDAEYTTCITRLAALAPGEDCHLDNVGLPQKGGKTSPPKMFEVLAKDAEANTAIKSIHDRLSKEGVWLWTGGAIEAHLGLNAKSESAWASYIVEVKGKGLDASTSDPGTVRDFIEWLAE